MDSVSTWFVQAVAGAGVEEIIYQLLGHCTAPTGAQVEVRCLWTEGLESNRMASRRPHDLWHIGSTPFLGPYRCACLWKDKKGLRLQGVKLGFSIKEQEREEFTYLQQGPALVQPRCLWQTLPLQRNAQSHSVCPPKLAHRGPSSLVTEQLVRSRPH